MKTTKKAFALFLAVLMAFSSLSLGASAATTYTGTITDDVTISSGDKIATDAVFTGDVTVESGVTISCGTFNGSVTLEEGINLVIYTLLGATIEGGVFNGEIINKGNIQSGSSTVPTINGKVTNYATVSGGIFKGEVVNDADGTITGGTFNGKVSNSGTITGGTYNSNVINSGTVSLATFNDRVENSGTIKSGTFYNVIVNTGTIGSSVNCIFLQNGTYYTRSYPTLTTKINTGSNPVVISTDSVLTIDDGGELAIGGSVSLNGKINVKNGGKLTLNNGSNVSYPSGLTTAPISVYVGGTISGVNASDVSNLTRKQYRVTVVNEDNENPLIAVNTINYESYDAFEGDTVYYTSNLETYVYDDCYTLEQILVYKTGTNKNNADNIITKSTSEMSGSFTMPACNVTVEGTFTETHDFVDASTPADCENDGFEGRKCSRCDKEEDGSKVIPKLGHSWSKWSYDESTTICKRTCTRCSKQETNTFLVLFNVSIVGYDQNSNITLDRKSTVTLHAKFADDGEIEGTQLYWVVNGTEQADDGSHSITLKQMTDTTKVSAKIKYNDNTKTTDEEVINIRGGFGQILKAFFKGLFGKLPVYDQKSNAKIA